jgi:hypothetical protein
MVVQTENGFRLYSKICELRKGYKRKVYFFSKRGNGWNQEENIPEGFEIILSPYTKLPMLKKKSCSSRSSLSIGGVIKTDGEEAKPPLPSNTHASQVTPIEGRDVILSLPNKHQK